MSLFWDQLLQLIGRGSVVPVVGRDLLTVQYQGRETGLYRILAQRLAEYLGVPGDQLPEGAEINTVACRYLATGARLEDIYPALKIVMPADAELPVPESLAKLAAIEPLKLFVTTTFDSLLARAIDGARFDGKPRTRVFTYTPNNVQDLNGSVQGMDDPAVYHLLGKLSAIPDYAVTQEDTLEFMHAQQSDARQPHVLFDELNRSNLLILGCGLGGWLARFFMRAAKRQRLIETRGSTDYVADARISEDNNMVYFLKHFSARTKLYESGDAREFIDALYQRWTAHRRKDPPAPDAAPTDPDSRPAGDEGAVFLSYASEDKAAVIKLKEALEAQQVDVFFDKDDLRAGDDYEARLRQSIGNCSVFIPVISGNTLTGKRRFFRIEWNQALEEALKVAPSQRFIVPVVIDGTAPTESAVPEKFRKLHWEPLRDGQPPPEFVAAVKQLYRQYQKLYAGAM